MAPPTPRGLGSLVTSSATITEEATSRTEHAAGDVLDGRYRLVDLIGRGGFGDVWRAEELLPGGAPFRDVALKLLTSGVADVEHWAEEAKLLASFRHPSLVTIYSAGILNTAPPQPFVAMELLIGDTLAHWQKQRRRSPWRRVLRWARDVAAALDVIHVRGVVHLDLKPANLFLGTDGAIKVLDFGIAKRAGAPELRMARRALPPPSADLATAEFVADAEALAETQMAMGTSTQRAVIGTPGFIAPEVIEQAEPTAATDAYALAVVIVMLITGRLPQAAHDEPTLWTDPSAVSAWWSDLRDATLRGDLRDLTEDPAKLPRGLVAMLHRLLAVDPAARKVLPGKLFAILDEAWERPHGVKDPPYPGLDPMGPEAEGLLFGRDDDLTRLGRELEFESCVVLQGVRGVGKTSLALAGLVPYLAHRGADGKDDWIAVKVRPGASPDAALGAALAAIAPELEDADLEALSAWCESSPIGLVLFVDPLEELISMAPRPERDAAPLPISTYDGHSAGGGREGASQSPSIEIVPGATRLTALLAGIADTPTRPGLRLLGAVREEDTPELLQTSLGAPLRASLRFVGGPATTAVKDLVAAPARLAGAEVKGMDRVTAEVRAELRALGSRLPFVALALRGWWATRETSAAGQVVLHGDRWKEMGGISGALARHADRIMAGLDPDQRKLGGELMARLSTTDGTPIGWMESSLAEALGKDPQAMRAVLSRLTEAQLVRSHGGELEIGHVALLTGWPFLMSARLAAMDWIAFRERLREAAVVWDRASNHADFLWRGALLKELNQNRSFWAGGLSATEREFVRESRRRARIGVYLKLVALTAVVMGIVGIIAWNRAAEREQAAADARRKAAEERAYLFEVVAKSRRTEDPFHRAAWIADAITKHSTDGMLPLDLASAVGNVPHALFLTLDHIEAPAFPWDDRWVIGGSSGPTLTVIDLRPAESDVIEDVNLDADPEQVKLKNLRDPRVVVIRPHADPLVERVPFVFDTSLVTRGVSGEVRVFRMRENGKPALAAIAPMRCTGAVRAAEAAPVIACASDDEIVRWDLRRGTHVDRHHFQGGVLDISADGARVAAANGKRVLMWAPSTDRQEEFIAQQAVVLGRWSPRDPVLAVVESLRFELVSMEGTGPRAALLEIPSERTPLSARWDPGGLDLAVCAANGAGKWHYLRTGGRAPSDPAPADSNTPCVAPPQKSQPKPITSTRGFDELANRDVGHHLIGGGWELPDGRYLTRDLLLVRAAACSTCRFLRFHGRDASGAQEVLASTDSVVQVTRDGAEGVAMQVGGDVRLFLNDGALVLSRKGNLIHRCDDRRLLSWSAEGTQWRFFDARSDSTLVTLPRDPGFVLGADAACTTVYTQRLDGALVASSLVPGAGESRVIAQANGYVYDARRSAGGGAVAPGLLLALSSGAIARIDDGTTAVRVLGYATPRASAIADGLEPGDVAYADATGVVVLRADGGSGRVLEAPRGSTWEDLSVSPDKTSMLLASADRLAVLDLSRGEILGSLPLDGMGRLTAWDEQGSVLAWSFDRAGVAVGQVIPRSPALVDRIAREASNLTVQNGKLALRR